MTPILPAIFAAITALCVLHHKRRDLSPGHPGPAPLPPGPMTQEQVEGALRYKAAEKSEQLDWGGSIVDLLKLLGLDSSMAARKQLAGELGYAGPLDGSAKMNTELHGLVMEQVAQGAIKIS